jgi:excisionase family DNA binding protein
VNAGAQAQAHSSRASARVGSHLRDARALTPGTQRSQLEKPSRNQPAPGGEHTRAYTVEQVAEMLHVGRDKIYYLLRTGQLRSVKIGKLRRITNWHLAEFIATLEDRQR